jgi:hypothetical protein
LPDTLYLDIAIRRGDGSSFFLGKLVPVTDAIPDGHVLNVQAYIAPDGEEGFEWERVDTKPILSP